MSLRQPFKPYAGQYEFNVMTFGWTNAPGDFSIPYKCYILTLPEKIYISIL